MFHARDQIVFCLRLLRPMTMFISHIDISYSDSADLVLEVGYPIIYLPLL
jgi:hypothetical protein